QAALGAANAMRPVTETSANWPAMAVPQLQFETCSLPLWYAPAPFQRTKSNRKIPDLPVVGQDSNPERLSNVRTGTLTHYGLARAVGTGNDDNVFHPLRVSTPRFSIRWM